MAKFKKEILQIEIDSMLEGHMIEECESPWPVVLIAKKDGITCVYIDYRQFNEITIVNKYPMPQIDGPLHSAKRTPFRSTIDLKTRFHRVRFRAEDQDKTAFITIWDLPLYKNNIRIQKCSSDSPAYQRSFFCTLRCPTISLPGRYY